MTERPDPQELPIQEAPEPVAGNQRLYDGQRARLVGWAAGLYAALHLAALNGISIAGMTGGLIDLPFLPRFPVETWNFRILHVAGALALGFLLYAGSGFPDQARAPSGWRERLGAGLLAPAALAFAAALWFAVQIDGGKLWNGMDAGIRWNETWLFGVPLMVATVRRDPAVLVRPHARATRTAWPDVVLIVCGFAVAAYLVTIYGTDDAQVDRHALRADRHADRRGRRRAR
ncbi:MAG: hypothetical protein U5L06_13360 [Rhodovibrio sp.]|nr:hypothetical protein [Rhodovibrio sp.]